ncbi:MAG TPA: aldehyde dehydrogenase family protein [Gemmatales bacterium]|nr:aldehyde dehydrogenase family protein [Gemmatales bacterium]HMP60955.1 aldehyde dehydrogenase family protein [Gemmatales bacterium]
MLHLPVLRFGEPYKSLDVDPVVHFATGEQMAEMSRANGALVERDMRHAQRARALLRDLPAADVLAKMKAAAQLFLEADLPMGDGVQSPTDFVKLQSATTGLPENMCRANMAKNEFVLKNLDRILDALTRGLDLGLLSRGHGIEARGVPLSYQAQSPVLGMVLPNNSPGVHALWLPVPALQVGLIIKPGSAEPWTPYRMVAAFVQAGLPRQAFAVYPGGHDVGNAVLTSCTRALIFGGEATVNQYKGNPRVQVHGPGWSKVLVGSDCIDQWESYLDVMAQSVLLNSGRSCINASAIYVPRHGRAIAAALAERLGPIEPTPPDDPQAKLAAFTMPSLAEAIHQEIEQDLKTPGVEDCTARFGPRLVRHERHAYLRPTVLFAASPDLPVCRREYLFPFVVVVECAEEQMLAKIGPTLVATVITKNAAWQRALLDATHVDRLNFGPIPTTQLNWLQPHEGNIIDFLFRSRAFQSDPQFAAV